MKEKRSIAVVMGTRPEGIKLCPLILQMRALGIPTSVITSGQHAQMLGEVLSAFSVKADISLPPSKHGENLSALIAGLLQILHSRFCSLSPSLVIVQGDTATAYAAALSAFLLRIPVMHLEAGLRSKNPFSPFLEESFRRGISAMATLHIAPTAQEFFHLWREGVPKKSVYLFGNTVEDALRRFLPAPSQKKGPMVLTVHRREHSEAQLRGIFCAVEDIVRRYPSLSLLYPVHPSPRVRTVAKQVLGEKPRI